VLAVHLKIHFLNYLGNYVPTGIFFKQGKKLAIFLKYGEEFRGLLGQNVWDTS
jgi:hypothetical protein